MTKSWIDFQFLDSAAGDDYDYDDDNEDYDDHDHEDDDDDDDGFSILGRPVGLHAPLTGASDPARNHTFISLFVSSS